MPIHGYPGGVISATPPTVSVSSASGVWTTEKQLQYQAQGVWPPGGVYPISRSLRFNSADSAYLNRTPGSASNRRTWTWSSWVKRSVQNTYNKLLTVVAGSAQTNMGIDGDELVWYNDTGSSATYFYSNALYRDPSAWYHIVIAIDTTQATASDRIKMYVNGSQITARAANYPAQNLDTQINSANQHQIGASFGSAYWSGYMTEINFIDGQALTPSSFGQTNSNTGVWEPKAYSGTYGTNGFYLNFSDNSGTTSTTLGKDYSGNGNNWTPNNFSVTAGAGNDSLVDTPTSYGTDTGVGGTVRGNYCTWNPLDVGNAVVIPANGNLDIRATGAQGWWPIAGTLGASSGKFYFEATPTGDNYYAVGVQRGPSSNNVTNGNGKAVWYEGRGYIYDQDFNTLATYASYTVGDIIGVAFDVSAGTISFYKNNTLQGTITSSNIANVQVTPSALLYPNNGTNIVTWTSNFGQRAFTYTAPSGYKALCTQNLSTPTVVQGDDYFNTVLYTGTGSSLSVTGVGFQPDFTWIKGRSGATDHGLYDAVRGVQKQLESNTDTAETTETTGLTAFGTDGFTVGALAQLNTNTATYVAWNWKANGAGSSNTAGTITSTVSANQTAGFSVLTYTGTGANATVGHGLGAAPSMIICKRRSATENWCTYHASLGATKAVFLNLTDAETTNVVFFNNTAPTSSLFSVGTNASVNANTSTYVAYCFAAIPGFSAFGSYTGNGSSDGPFVYCGFRPAFLLTKRASTAGAWHIYDSVRSTYNINDIYLIPDTSAAENSGNNGIDFLSNGFKLRSANTGTNENGTTIIYAAFASNPFKYALAR